MWLIVFLFSFRLLSCFSPCLLIVFTYFFNAFLSKCLPWSVILCCCEGYISVPARYSYLSIFPDDKAAIFAVVFVSLIVLITLYADPNRFFWTSIGLSGERVVSMTKNEYRSTVRFLYKLLKLLKSISDEWLIAVFWSSQLFGIFMIKKCVVFSLISFDREKYDCDEHQRKYLVSSFL